MNIFRIFLDSSIAAQIIMALLLIFSIWSWAIFLKKLFDFSKIKKLSKRFMSTFRFHQQIKDLENMGALLSDNPYGRILRSGLDEFKKLSVKKRAVSPVQNPQQSKGSSFEELSDNIRLSMERAKLGEIESLEKSLPVLGTFVSVSPFLGLLGTVWGIMEAFLDIRARGSAHITIVAPGISDALITTVYGLLVAIPALIFFNIFKSRVNSYSNKIDQFINEVFAKLRKELLCSREN
jgi:biopolymer transport protein TolQ